MRVDEILAALPDVGLGLNCLQEKSGGADESRWYACIREAKGGPDASLWDGWGPDPLYAMVMACTRAGVNVTDE